MKTGTSKLFRKLAQNRSSNRLNSIGKPKEDNGIKPVPDFWKARTIKASELTPISL